MGYKIVFCLLACFGLEGASLRLENNAPCPLKAVVEAADGSILGELLVESSETKIWSEESGFTVKKPPSRSITPLKVYWYCPSGETFSFSDSLSTGTLVRSRDGAGNKSCRNDQGKEK